MDIGDYMEYERTVTKGYKFKSSWINSGYKIYIYIFVIIVNNTIFIIKFKTNTITTERK